VTERAFADARLLDELTAIAARASVEILEIRGRAINARQKPDATPVTDADHAAEEIILRGLSRLLPGIPVISEEDFMSGPRPRPDGIFVLVDPLDGTREFIAGRDEFTVNIALIENGSPHAGIVAAPARACVWRGSHGKGAQKLRLTPDGTAADATPIKTRRLIPPRVVLVSRSHPDALTQAFIDRQPAIEAMPVGSSLKFGLLAEGAADLYPRLAPVREWDAAAGHALLVAAGGVVVAPDGSALKYGRPDRNFTIPGFVAWANPDASRQGAS
jgi:3'(2'), 5'-bisphosphate nucleotidase